ncbi:hypothetical protein [Bradyrhizobium sp.]|jgi:hypothetical protein|uniref:hypothetical protein n=1 Tax=Bradyrhizobium sp. TaxID=376 RepID=UPI003D11B044
MPYPERYVVFLDILGFSEIVRKTDTDALTSRFDALVKTLNEINSRENELDDVVGDDFKFQTFSDSIVMSANASTNGLLYVLYAARQLALNLLGNGILTRGAIAKGKLHHVGSVMFGPAFLDAHRIEHEIAKYPRIILSEKVFEDLKLMKPGLIEPTYILGDDGPPYLHILQGLKKLNSDSYFSIEGRNSSEVIEAQSYQRILQNLLDHSIHEPRHFEKVRWFALYWNGTFGVAPDAPIGPVTFPGSRDVSWIA